MRKTCLIFVLLIGGFSLSSQVAPKPYVDERIELLSTVFRLGEAYEYISNEFPYYTNKVDSFFAPVKEHSAVQFVDHLRTNYYIGYDAVMSYATNLEITNGKLIFRPNRTVGSLDSRWEEEPAQQFLKLLNDFYITSNFHDFFEQNRYIHDTISSRFSKIMEDVNFGWFEQFYGQKPKGDFHLVPSLLNGQSNYGSTIGYTDDTEEIYAIIGSWGRDSIGFPVYENGVLPIVIHEFNHAFCNPLIFEYYPYMEKKARRFFQLNQEKMQSQAYGNARTMMCEILVRACVIKYFQSEGFPERSIRRQIVSEQAKGFVWIDELVELLDVYEENRSYYLSLESFMPEIIHLQNNLSPGKEKREFDNQCAKITRMTVKHKAKKIDPNLKKLTLTFDRPMYTKANGISYGTKGQEFFPTITDVSWNEETKREFVIFIELEPDKEYSLSFPGHFFYTEDMYPLKDSYFLDFGTAKL